MGQMPPLASVAVATESPSHYLDGTTVQEVNVSQQALVSLEVVGDGETVVGCGFFGAEGLLGEAQFDFMAGEIVPCFENMEKDLFQP